MEIGICLAAAVMLLVFYDIFGQTTFLLAGQKPGNGLCLLTGVFVYHTLFQAEALPLLFLLQPLKRLSVLWLLTLIVVFAAWLLLRKRKLGRIFFAPARPQANPWLLALMAAAVLVQLYYIVTTEYLGWDTSFYVGTIATNVSSNSMYRLDGETGWGGGILDLRYALSSFYLHGSVWCQVFPVRAIYYAKIVQGGVLGILANCLIFELGRFLFRHRRYEGKLSERQVSDCAAGMVIAAVFLNFFYNTMFTTSEFLLHRALEAKAYCANFILPFVFLACLMFWREGDKKEIRWMMFFAGFGSVALSMSALVTVPALFTVMMFPELLRRRSLATLRLYLACVLPNAVYYIVYTLYDKNLLRIKV